MRRHAKTFRLRVKEKKTSLMKADGVLAAGMTYYARLRHENSSGCAITGR